MNKAFACTIGVLVTLSGISQEPLRVVILNPGKIKVAFINAVNTVDTSELSRTFVINSKLLQTGKLINSKISNIDTSSLIYRDRAKFLSEYERIIRLSIPAELKRRIVQKGKKYCISVLVSKCAIYDYDNEPYVCNP